MTKEEKEKTMTKKVIAIVLMVALIFCLSGCKYEHYSESEAYEAKYDVKNAANDFKVMRRLTVMNMRTDALVLRVEGYFSLSNNSNHELEVTMKLDDGTYRIDYIYLNDNVIYVVEDITEKTLPDMEVHFGDHGFGGEIVR